jgi:hypothetical protein
MPGAFVPVFDPTPPDVWFEYDMPMLALGDCVESAIDRMYPEYLESQTADLSAKEISGSVLSAAACGAAIKISRSALDVSGRNAGFNHLDVPHLPQILSEAVDAFGEFVGPDGRGCVLQGPASTCRAFARMSNLLRSGVFARTASRGFWLPTMVDDEHTRSIIANRLSRWFSEKGIQLAAPVLYKGLFSGDLLPEVAAGLCHLAPREKRAVVRLFSVWSTPEQFVLLFNDEVGRDILVFLELCWPRPRVTDLGFDYNYVAHVERSVRVWKSMQPILESDFRVEFSPLPPGGYQGWQSQIVTVKRLPSGKFETSGFYHLDHEERTFFATVGSPAYATSLPRRYTSVGSVARGAGYLLARDSVMLSGARSRLR